MPSVVRRLVPLAVIAVFAGCGDLTGPESIPAARRLWDSQNLSSYQYVTRKTCFCVFSDGPKVVTVINDQVVSVVEQGTGLSVPTVGWSTVDGLFAEAERADADHRLREVTFHQAEGYPTLIEICCREVDSGVRHVITDLFAT